MSMPAISESITSLRTTDVDKESFGLRLRELRTAAGLSQLVLAQRTGISQSSISAWEAGINVPLITQAAKIAEALGVDIGEMVKPTATEPNAPKRGRPPKSQDIPTAAPQRRTGRKLPGK